MKIGLKELGMKLEDPANLRSGSVGLLGMACIFLVWSVIKIIIRWHEPTALDDEAFRLLCSIILFVLGSSMRGAARIYERIIALEKSQEELRRSQAERP